MLLLLCLAAAFLLLRRRRGADEDKVAPSFSSSSSDAMSMEDAPAAAEEAMAYANLLRGVEIGEQIGEGAFGKVYRGTRGETAVAVKQVLRLATPSNRRLPASWSSCRRCRTSTW